jgi:hypothetical protein
MQQPAFCETFEKPHPGGRGGEIDEAEWSFSRHGHMQTEQLRRAPASSTENGTPYSNTPTFCGTTFNGLVPPNDVKLCDGTDGGGFLSKQLNEVFHDFGDFGINSMRIRQQFDFTGRKGTIVFDVDAKLNVGFEGHGWWNELWITEDPAPVPYHGAPTVGSFPRRGIGFQIAPRQLETCGAPGFNEVGGYFITENYALVREGNLNGKCFKSADKKLNRFKVIISTSAVEFWVSNADNPKLPPARVASVSGLNLKFSRGYVHFQHSQYNAAKANNASSSQTYRWDNIAFDGPAYPRPRGYDVPDELKNFESGGMVGKSVGYYLSDGGGITPRTVTVPGVSLADALKAEFNFSISARRGETLRYRFNGNAWHDFQVPENIGQGDDSQPGDATLLRAFTAPVALTELVAGDNKLEVTLAENSPTHTVIANMDLTIIPSK